MTLDSWNYKIKVCSTSNREIINWRNWILIKCSGDIVRLIKKADGAWWEGEIYKSQNGSRGWFPSNYVRELKPAELEKIKSKDEKNPKKSITQNAE